MEKIDLLIWNFLFFNFLRFMILQNFRYTTNFIGHRLGILSPESYRFCIRSRP